MTTKPGDFPNNHQPHTYESVFGHGGEVIPEVWEQGVHNIRDFFARTASVGPSKVDESSVRAPSVHTAGATSITYTARAASEPTTKSPVAAAPAESFLDSVLAGDGREGRSTSVGRAHRKPATREQAKRRGTKAAAGVLATVLAAGGVGYALINKPSPAAARDYVAGRLPAVTPNGLGGPSSEPTPEVTPGPILSPTPEATKPPHVPVSSGMDPNAVKLQASVNKYMYDSAPAARKLQSKAIGAWIMSFYKDKTVAPLPLAPALTNDAFEVELRAYFTQKGTMNQFKSNLTATEKLRLMSAVVRLYDVSLTGVPRTNIIRTMDSVVHPVASSPKTVAAAPTYAPTIRQTTAPTPTRTTAPLPLPTPKPTPTRSNPVPDPRPTPTKSPTSR